MRSTCKKCKLTEMSEGEDGLHAMRRPVETMGNGTGKWKLGELSARGSNGLSEIDHLGILRVCMC